MSKIRHLKKGASEVEYSTFDGQLIECRKSAIQRRALQMSHIRLSNMRPIESKQSDPTNTANRIKFATFDPTECTRLVSRLLLGRVTARMEVSRLLRFSEGTSVFLDHFSHRYLPSLSRHGSISSCNTPLYLITFQKKRGKNVENESSSLIPPFSFFSDRWTFNFTLLLRWQVLEIYV